MRCVWCVLLVFVIFGACGQRGGSARLRETKLRMKQRCAQAGLQARREWVTRYDSETFSDSPEYGYSEQLNTCLYADEYSDNGIRSSSAAFIAAKNRRDRFVLDVFANRILAEYTEHDQARRCNVSNGRGIRCTESEALRKIVVEFNSRRRVGRSSRVRTT